MHGKLAKASHRRSRGAAAGPCPCNPEAHTVKPSVISSIGHVALRARDLEHAHAVATGIMGLRASRSGGEAATFTSGRERYSLQVTRDAVDAFDHLGLEAEGPEAVREIRRRLERRGIPVISDRPLDAELPEGLAFELPGRVLIEVYTGMPHDQPDYVGTGVRPNRLGHVNVYVPDPKPALDVLVEVLDFRISDFVRGGAFTRCNADHHGVAVLPGDNKLHHHAWEVKSIADLARLGDVLFASERRLIEGPLRHGIGRNIAAYFEGLAGEAVEYYTDMELILDDDAHEPGDWSVEGIDWYTSWTPRLPLDVFRTLGVPLAAFAGAPL
jgi:catechol 2,3-dioxygenase